MTILDQLAAHARQRVAADQEKHSLHELKARCKEAGRAGGERFFQAMKRPGMSFICEVKKASPRTFPTWTSRGTMRRRGRMRSPA